MFIYELHPGNRHFEPKVMEVDGEPMIFLESIGWWKWFQSLPQGTNPCDILNVKPCLGLQQHLNLPKLLAKYFLLSPKHVHLRNHRNLSSSFSKSTQPWINSHLCRKTGWHRSLWWPHGCRDSYDDHSSQNLQVLGGLKSWICEDLRLVGPINGLKEAGAHWGYLKTI